MDIEESRASRDLCRVAIEISDRGWCLGTGGNFSVTLSHEPLQLLITPSGANKRHLAPRDLVMVGRNAEAVEESAGTPSAETLLHCRIAEVTGSGSVLHTHSVPATLLGEHFLSEGGFKISGYEMLKGLEGIRTHEAEVWIPVLENTQDIPLAARRFEELERKMPVLYGFLLSGHGLYTWGRTLEAAHRHVEILEFLFECLARRVRFRPPGGVD